ncbi:hypothetical protein BSKO_09361 [Bryopsis sp. KO-2023]|nr:hypothetical protein BSKO_09361 [Bryopsis sp. KO-2023]
MESDKTSFGKVVGDAGAMSLNIFSSVLIIMVNKFLIGTSGYGFNFIVTLTGAHFLASSGAMHVLRMLGFIGYGNGIPLKEMAGFVAINGICIVSLNLSLMINSVGFYQIAKLLNIPCVCLLEHFWLGKTFSPPVLISIAAVIVGVGTVTVTDITVVGMGLLMVIISVISTGTMQTMCRYLQKKHGVSSSELLLRAGMLTGMLLILLGPLLDRFITGNWVHNYVYTHPAITLLAASSMVAVLVNLSSFMCLGRFSAVTFQVMGHTKTFMVLTGGVLLFHETISPKQLMGMSVAVAGMISYGYYSSLTPAAPPSTSVPLLNSKGSENRAIEITVDSRTARD